jgi:hypothetical protein
MTQLSHFETVLLWVSCYRWKGGSCALWQIFVLNVKHEHFLGMWIIFLWWLYMVFFKFQVFINKKNQSNIDVLPALTWYYISKHSETWKSYGDVDNIDTERTRLIQPKKQFMTVSWLLLTEPLQTSALSFTNYINFLILLL